MAKSFDTLMRKLGVTEEEIELVRKFPGLRRSISMFIKSQCRNVRNRPRITAKQIQEAVTRVHARGEDANYYQMGLEFGIWFVSASRIFREILRDHPKLEKIYGHARATIPIAVTQR